jgi:phosphonoacetaldehyde reductase
MAEVLEGARTLHRARVDAVIAIGGGSVLDFAKLATAAAARGDRQGSDRQASDIIHGPTPFERRRHLLVLVPTTAGTGSEVTSIAVATLDGAKRSYAHEGLRGDIAVVDPDLTGSMPRHVAAATGMDALSQGAESYWSVRSTGRSRGPAREAIELAVGNVAAACLGSDPAARAAMSRAALQSGRAIELTQTTAPHALSYLLTTRFGVPHGHACGLFLGPVLEYNAAVTDADVADARGAGFVQDRIAEILKMIGALDAGTGRRVLDGLMERLGLATRLSRLGVGRRDVADLADAALRSPRLAANPRTLDRKALCDLITARL